MTEKKLYNVSRMYHVVRVASVLASSEEEAVQLAKKNGSDIHWKEYDGDYIESVDYDVEEE